MSYFVKICDKCKTANHPSMSYCAKCGADLPTIKHETDTKPMAPPAYARAELQPEPNAAAPNSTNNHPSGTVQCRIVDIDMPFWSMVNLMVKAAVAAIPALIIITIYLVFATAILAAIGVGLQAS